MDKQAELEALELEQQEFRSLVKFPAWVRLDERIQEEIAGLDAERNVIPEGLDALISMGSATARMASLSFFSSLPQLIVDTLDEQIAELRKEILNETEG